MKKVLALLIITFFALKGVGQTTTLPGKGTDADGTITSYQWRKVSGPAGGIITSPAATVTTVTGLVPGIYLYELTVTDNQGATNADTVQVTVIAGNLRPKADAGPDQIITLPGTGFNVTLDSSDLAYFKR